MTTTAKRIVREIRELPPAEQREVCAQVIELAGHLDYEDLSDAGLTALAAETFAQLDTEEHHAGTR
jgi:hypothetical protein